MVCLFCDFVSGNKKSNMNGFPFIAIHHTKHTLSFLSTDFLSNEEGHILIIPKKHFEYIEEVPKLILNDLINHVSLASKITKKKHSGCNILVNNGKSAGQYIPHVHFHIIPRDEGDKIKIEVWKKGTISGEKFKKISHQLKKEFLKKN